MIDNDCGDHFKFYLLKFFGIGLFLGQSDQTNRSRDSWPDGQKQKWFVGSSKCNIPTLVEEEMSFREF